jgi:serine/threonine protein kinase/tetratricopeptide (TPR) repeat protein
MIGETIGHYGVIEKIGSGGMGEVYRAHDEQLDRDVALKVLPIGTLADEAKRKLLRKEAQVLAKLNHPNIATVHEFNCQGGVDFLAMELIQGRSLREILKQGPIAEQEIQRLGLQLSEALAVAHEHGVVHCDLKPANIMITPDGRLKILDFGLAKLVQSAGTDVTQSSTTAQNIPGTLPYMAPEQLLGEGADIRADVYAVGAVLYEMATGRRAFPESNAPRLIDSILHKEPTPPREVNTQISDAMQSTILKALEKDPDRRQQSARELLLELGKLNASAISAPPAVSIEQSHAPPLEIAHVLFMDIVAYSLMPMDLQRHRLRELQQIVLRSPEVIRAKSADQLIPLPTGDGMALVFFEDPEAPVRCALELSRALRSHPEIKLRMGLHTGPVFRVADVNANRNVAGGGINTAQRVMDCGDAGHILISKAMVDVLGQLTSWGPSLHDLGEIAVKHGVRIQLFNLYTDDMGNAKVPAKVRKTKLARKQAIAIEKQAQASRLGLGQYSRPQSAPKISVGSEVPQSSSGTHTIQIHLPQLSRRYWLSASGCVLVLITSVFAIPKVREWISENRFKRCNPPTGIPCLEDGKHLAVLPFVVEGDRNALGYIAEGLGEELSRKLSALQKVQVVSTAASEAAAANHGIDLKGSVEAIARNLGANLVVQGTVLEAGGWVHINISFLDIAGRRRLWNRDFSDAVANVNLLDRSDQIYSQIVEHLKLKPTQEEQARAARPTDKIEAYDLYLKGRNAAHNGRDLTALRSAIQYHNAAVKKDSHFALAYSGLADANRAMYRETKDASWASKALGAAQQAVMLNDSLPEVHLALGNAYREAGKTEEAIAEFERVKKLSPNSDEPWRLLGRTYMSEGRRDDAIDALVKATEVNPYSLINQNALGEAYFRFGQYDNALAAFQHVTALDPDNYLGHMNIGAIYFAQARYDEAIAETQKAIELQPAADLYSNLGLALLYLKRYPEAVAALEESARTHPNDEVVVGNLADGYLWSGQREKAKATYKKAISLAIAALGVNPKDTGVLGDLALYYAKTGQAALADYYIRQARSIDASNAELIYCEAVVRALANQQAEAMNSLRLAFEKGISPRQAKLDPELKSLQGRPEFQKLVAEYLNKSN